MKNEKLLQIVKRMRIRLSRFLRAIPRVIAPLHTKAFAKRATSIVMAGILFLTILPAFLLSNLFTQHAKAATASQGAKYATSSSDCTTVAGTNAWTSPGNAAANDGSVAVTPAMASATSSQQLKCVNFGFSIPTGVTIAGVTMQVNRRAGTASRVTDGTISLIKGGTVQGNNKATATTWPTTLATVSYGSTSDLWGLTLAVSDVNAATFGAAIVAARTGSSTATASVDSVSLTVQYTFNPTFSQSAYRWFNDANSDVTSFAKAWGKAGVFNEENNDIQKTSDGGYITTGRTNGYGGGDYDMVIAKYDSGGTLSWSKTWGGTGGDIGRAVIQLSDGGYAVTGDRDMSGAIVMFIAKYDSSGNLSWSKTWGGTVRDQGLGLVQMSDGGIIVTGYASNLGSGAGDAFIAKYDSSGTLSWSKTWGGTASDSSNAIAVTSDGGFTITGNTGSFGLTNGAMFIAKYDSSGTLSWSKTWGGSSGAIGNSIFGTSDGGVVVGGTTTSYGAGNEDAFIAKYDSSGTLSWSKTWGGTGYDRGFDVIQSADGGYALSGETTLGAGNLDAYLAKYDSSGNLSWSKTFGGTNYEYGGRGLVQSTDGGYVLAGLTDSYGVGLNDGLMIKFDSTGTIAGCSSPMCQAASPTPSTPSPTTSSPSASTTTPSPTTSTPTSTTSAPTFTMTSILAAPALTVGSALNGVAQDTATIGLAEQSTFRLRLNLHVASAPALAGGYFSFKLQYAPRGADNVCDTSFTDESGNFSDVTTSTAIAFADNATASDGQTIASSVNDPTHSGDGSGPVLQEYNESNNTSVVNNITAGQDGLWDFALKDNGAPANTAYCFRLVTDTGSTLSSYNVVPQITTLPPDFSQENYRWFKGQDAVNSDTSAQSWGSTSGDDFGLSSVATTDGGYIMTGMTKSYVSDTTNGDMFIAKYAANGQLSWSKTWGGSGADFGNSIIQTSDGGYAVTGKTESFGGGADDVFIVKYDDSGTLSWNKTFGTGGNDTGNEIVQTSDGGYAVVGTYNNTDILIIKYTGNGSFSWSKTWDSGKFDYGNSIIQTTDGGYAITGEVNTLSETTAQAAILKMDSFGALTWVKYWGGSSYDSANSIIQTTDGGYAITGHTDSYDNGSIFLAKFDDTGTLTWSKTLGANGTDKIGNSIIQTTDGGYAITGKYVYGQIFLAKYDSSGNNTWKVVWKTANNSYKNSVVQIANGGYLVAGALLISGGTDAADAMVLRYSASGDMSGCLAATCEALTAATSSPSASSGNYSGTFASKSDQTLTPSATTVSPSARSVVVTGNTTFAESWGGSGNEDAKSIIKTSDGSIIVTGETKSYGEPNGDMFIAKYTAGGQLVWMQTWGGNAEDYGNAVAELSDGGFVVTGSTASYGVGLTDVFTAVFTASGTLQQNTTWGSNTSAEYAVVVTAMSDGGFVIAGNYLAGGNGRVFINRYTSTSSLSWSKSWYPGSSTNQVYSIINTSDGGLAFTGATKVSEANGDAVLVKMSSSGVIEFSKTWGGTNIDIGRSLIQSSDGGYVIAGNTNSSGFVAGGYDMFAVKYDATGKLIWNKTVGGTTDEVGRSVSQTADGGYLLVGDTISYGAGLSDIVISKLSGSGSVTWTKTWGTSDAEYANAATVMPDNGILIAGRQSLASLDDQAIIAKLNVDASSTNCSSMCSTVSASLNTPSATVTSQSVTETAITTMTYLTSGPSAVTQSPTISSVMGVALLGKSEATPGSPLAPQDTLATMTHHDDQIRLRLILKNIKSAYSSTVSLKLQVSPKVGSCDTSFTGETYTDVGSTAAFKYYTNTNLSSGDWARTSPTDPIAALGSTYNDNYQQSATISNGRHIVVGQNLLWDLSLATNDDTIAGSYCFRIVKNDDSLLMGGYTRIFELAIAPSAGAAKQVMRHGRIINESTSGEASPFYW